MQYVIHDMRFCLFLVLVGVSQEEVSTVEEVLNLLDAGTAMRHVGATNMNEMSSRSHCIFTLNLGICISLYEPVPAKLSNIICGGV